MKTRFSALPVPTVRRIFQPYPDHETSFSDFSALPVRRVFRRRTAFGQPARFRREPPDAHYPDAVPTLIRTRRQIHRRPYLFRLRPGQPAPRVGVQGAGAGAGTATRSPPRPCASSTNTTDSRSGCITLRPTTSSTARRRSSPTAVFSATTLAARSRRSTALPGRSPCRTAC